MYILIRGYGAVRYVIRAFGYGYGMYLLLGTGTVRYGYGGGTVRARYGYTVRVRYVGTEYWCSVPAVPVFRKSGTISKMWR